MRTWIVMSLVGLLALGVAGFADVEFSFWHIFTEEHATALQKLADGFMDENPGVKVDLVFQGGYGDLSRKLFASLAAEAPPTLSLQYENWTTQWLDALVDLDQYIDSAVLDDVHPRFMQEFEGRLVTLPFNRSIIIMYHRKDLVPEPPTTWDELLGLASELTQDTTGDGEVDFWAFHLRPRSPEESYLTYLEQVGGSILSEDWTTVTINDAYGLEAAEFVTDLAQYSLVDPAFSSGPFGEGVIAMFIGTSAGMPFNQAAADRAGVELGFATIPYPEHGKPASQMMGTNVAIFEMGQTEAQIEAAALFIEYLLRPENTIFWAETTGYLPVTTTAIESEEWQALSEENPFFAAQTEQLVIGGYGQLLHPEYWDMRSVITDYVEILVIGDMGPQEALDALADELEWILER